MCETILLTVQQSRLCSVVSDSLSVCKHCFNLLFKRAKTETKEPFFQEPMILW